VKIIVDHARCQGHANCVRLAPQVYELDEEGYNRMQPFEVKPGMEAAASKGARSCPEAAIKVVRDVSDSSGKRT
jgi:ferredoxin